jgi:hypothetical protein
MFFRDVEINTITHIMKKSIEVSEKEVVKCYLECKSMSNVRNKFKVCAKRIRSILISNGIDITMRKQPLDVDYFKYIDSAEKAYWLGFIAADGHISKTKYKLAFCVKDEDILFKLKNAINAGSPVSHRFNHDKRTNKTYEQYNIQITSKKFCEYIKQHGVTELKSDIFEFPNIEERFYSHFIRGMYDGDGSISIKSSSVRKQATCRINLLSTLECVHYIRDYLNNKFNWELSKIFSKHDQNIHYVSTQKYSLNFLNWIYLDSTPEMRLDRKYNKYIEYTDLLKIKKTWKIKNHNTGDFYEITNLAEFCKNNNLNDNLLRRNFKTSTICRTGKHAGWEITQ